LVPLRQSGLSLQSRLWDLEHLAVPVVLWGLLDLMLSHKSDSRHY
jgi:hypothetical protein